MEYVRFTKLLMQNFRFVKLKKQYVRQFDKLEFDEEVISMKKVLIGGFTSLIGSILSLAIAFIVGNNLVTAFDTDVGRLWSTILEMELLFPFIISVLFIVFGIVLMAVELFRKEK